MNIPGYVRENVGEDLDYGMSESEVRAILGELKSFHRPEEVTRPGDLFRVLDSIFHFNDEAFDIVWGYGVINQASRTTYVGFTDGGLAEIWSVIDEQTGPNDLTDPPA